jgi:hypothetical protein
MMAFVSQVKEPIDAMNHLRKHVAAQDPTQIVTILEFAMVLMLGIPLHFNLAVGLKDMAFIAHAIHLWPKLSAMAALTKRNFVPIAVCLPLITSSKFLLRLIANS